MTGEKRPKKAFRIAQILLSFFISWAVLVLLALCLLSSPVGEYVAGVVLAWSLGFSQGAAPVTFLRKCSHDASVLPTPRGRGIHWV